MRIKIGLFLLWLTASLIFISGPVVAENIPKVAIAMTSDGPWDEQQPIYELFKSEIQDLLGDEFEARFVDQSGTGADWTVGGVKSMIDRLLTDPNVDIIVTIGILSSHDVMTRRDLPKPVIASMVLDKCFQKLPEKDGASGITNLSYIAFPTTMMADIRLFREVVSFQKMAFVVSEYMLEGIPSLKNLKKEDIGGLNSDLDIQVISVGNSVEDALNAIPEDMEAVYVTPLIHLSDAELNQFIQGLIDRKLPSFSMMGEAEVEMGMMYGLRPHNFLKKLARRTALNLQSILLGEDAGTIACAFSIGNSPVLNQATCQEIGVYPSWSILTEAKVIRPDRKEEARKLTLSQAIKEVVHANLDLKAKDKEVAAGEQNINDARSNLLPQIDLSATGVQINEEQAGFQPEKTGTASATLTQVIFSDGALANYSVQKYRQNVLEEERRQLFLDTVLDVAEAYLNVLKALAAENIQSDNLKSTRLNKELAEVRVAVGYAGPGETYRWQSNLATDRKNVIVASASRNQAEIALNRILSRPAEERFVMEEAGAVNLNQITCDERILSYVDNPYAFRVLRSFMAEVARELSPELKQLDAAIAAQKRFLGTTKRAFFLPTLSLQAEAKNQFYEDGIGSEPNPLVESVDTNWSVGLNASFSLFKGGAKFADRKKAAEELSQLRVQRESLVEKIEQNIRINMHGAGATYASIRQAQDAAEAAKKSLDLITDSYSRGVVSLVDLVDAQNTALVANLAAANAVYDFIIDLMRVERAVGSFSVLRTNEETNVFFDRLDAYFENAGASDSIKR
ncbi:MAG: hypothetical protein B6244_13780 [Candidatus Cloacimonetes bacterium 4572_55]|nr:MAG: hypothetical protein B6244_13780 [Candidatus Cloacimonetes bacterium 4572_55]